VVGRVAWADQSSIKNRLLTDSIQLTCNT